MTSAGAYPSMSTIEFETYSNLASRERSGFRQYGIITGVREIGPWIDINVVSILQVNREIPGRQKAFLELRVF